MAVAAKKDHVRVLRQQLDAGGEDKRVFEPIERHNASPVFLAARFGSRRAVQLLLAHGADVDAANVLQQTPLDAAVGYGHTDIVLDLVQHGVDASAASTTAMFQAAKRGHADTLRLALDAGADATCSLDGESVLQFAVSKNQADVVRVLLDHGADRFRLGEGEGVGEGVGQGVRELLRSYFPYECEQMMQMFLGVVSSPQLSGYALLDMNAVALDSCRALSPAANGACSVQNAQLPSIHTNLCVDVFFNPSNISPPLSLSCPNWKWSKPSTRPVSGFKGLLPCLVLRIAFKTAENSHATPTLTRHFT